MNTSKANPVTIVMIEDDEGHARLIERNIRRAGVTNDIVQALLILLDLNLPDMSGVDILQTIKSNAHLRRSPVVVLTTTDDEGEIQRCYDLGANVYITKPVNYDSFANAIRQLGLFVAVMQVPTAD